MDYTNLLVTDAEGKTTLNEKALKDLLQKEGDKRATEASNTTKSKTEEELRQVLREEIEQEAKMDAQQKFQKEMEKKNADFEKKILEFNKKQVASLFESKKINKEDYEPFLSYVTSDTDKTLEMASKHLETIEKIAESKLQEKLKTNMGENATPPASGGNAVPKPELKTSF